MCPKNWEGKCLNKKVGDESVGPFGGGGGRGFQKENNVSTIGRENDRTKKLSQNITENKFGLENHQTE